MLFEAKPGDVLEDEYGGLHICLGPSRNFYPETGVIDCVTIKAGFDWHYSNVRGTNTLSFAKDEYNNYLEFVKNHKLIKLLYG